MCHYALTSARIDLVFNVGTCIGKFVGEGEGEGYMDVHYSKKKDNAS